MSDVQEGGVVAPKEIKVSEIKALLEQGLDRKEIAAHFGKSVAEMARTVWSNPKLKNLKKKGAPTIVLIDDEETVGAPVETAAETDETVADNATEEVEQAQAPASSNDSQWK